MLDSEKNYMLSEIRVLSFYIYQLLCMKHCNNMTTEQVLLFKIILLVSILRYNIMNKHIQTLHVCFWKKVNRGIFYKHCVNYDIKLHFIGNFIGHISISQKSQVLRLVEK